MHYYPHHIGDYQRDTASLSIAEHGAYRLMMDAYYVTEKPLPADLDALCRIVRALSKQERAAVERVASLFFATNGGTLTHKRIDAEIENYHDQIDTAKRAGRASAEKRALQRNINARSTPVQRPLDSGCNGTSTPPPTEGQPTKNQEPRTKDKESPAAPSPALPFESAEFADAWSRWKRHRSEIRKPLKPTMEAAQLNELKAMGEARAIAALNHTIAKGWQGIREPENLLPFHATHRQTPHRSDSANAPGRYS